MEEIKVGEYCRTEAGYISKIIKKHKDLIEFDEKIISRYGEESTYLYSDDFFGDETKEIIKHSPNIIDFIEVGDIVQTLDVLHNDIIYIWNEEMLKALKEDIENGIQIKSIVTKEQFEAMKYEVK